MTAIVKSNRLIAEFMGLQKHETLSLAKTPIQAYEHRCSLYAAMELQYHASWDWLMPVIEKISQHEWPDGEKAFPRTFGMPDASGRPMVRLNRMPVWVSDTLIEAAYISALDFINLINENNKENP